MMLIRNRGSSHRYVISELDHSTSNPSQATPSTGVLTQSQVLVTSNGFVNSSHELNLLSPIKAHCNQNAVNANSNGRNIQKPYNYQAQVISKFQLRNSII